MSEAVAFALTVMFMSAGLALIGAAIVRALA